MGSAKSILGIVGSVLSFFPPTSAIGMGMVLAAGVLKPKASRQSTTIKSNISSTQSVLRIIYGTAKVGTIDVYFEKKSGNSNYLWLVSVLGEGECEGIVEDQIWINKKKISEYTNADDIKYNFHSGSINQIVDADINTDLPQFTDAMQSVCYVAFRFKMGSESFTSIPSRKLLLKGLKIYNFKTYVTEWSNNPVLILYDYLTNKSYGGDINLSYFDMSSWESSYDYCVEKEWTFDYVFDVQSKFNDVINLILSSFRGKLIWLDGKLILKYTDLNFETPIFSIEEKHIALTSYNTPACTFNKPSRFNLPTSARVKFTDTNKEWALDDVVIGEKTGTTIDLAFAFIANRAKALSMGTYHLERQRLNFAISIVGRDDLAYLEVHDVVWLTCSYFGIQEIVCRITNMINKQDGTVGIGLQLDSEELYNDVYESEPADFFNINLEDPNTPPPSVENIVFEEKLEVTRGVTYLSLFVDFTAPLNYLWFDSVDVYQVLIIEGSERRKLLFTRAESDFLIPTVKEGEHYSFILQSRSTTGVKQELNDALAIDYTIIGIEHESPTPQAGELILNYAPPAVTLTSATVPDADIEGYEFRIGSSGSEWYESLILTTVSKPSVSYAGIRPGYHIFYCSPRSTNGLYSDTKVNAELFIAERIVTTAYLNDFATGTRENTILDGTSLIVDTTDGNLKGRYLSIEADMTELKKWYLYFEYTFSGTNSAFATWEEIGINDPVGETWEQFGLDEEDEYGNKKRWVDIFGSVDSSPIFDFIIYAGVTSIPTVDLLTGGLIDDSKLKNNYLYSAGRMEILTHQLSEEAQYGRLLINIANTNKDAVTKINPVTIRFGE